MLMKRLPVCPAFAALQSPIWADWYIVNTITTTGPPCQLYYRNKLMDPKSSTGAGIPGDTTSAYLYYQGITASNAFDCDSIGDFHGTGSTTCASSEATDFTVSNQEAKCANAGSSMGLRCQYLGPYRNAVRLADIFL